MRRGGAGDRCLQAVVQLPDLAAAALSAGEPAALQPTHPATLTAAPFAAAIAAASIATSQPASAIVSRVPSCPISTSAIFSRKFSNCSAFKFTPFFPGSHWPSF